MAHPLLLLVVLLLLWSSDIQCKSAVKNDIVLLMDQSSTISEKVFQDIRDFLSDIVRRCDIGPDKVQFGLTKYGTLPETVWDLNTYKTQQSLLTAIANLPQTGGGTNTGKALDHIYQNSFKAHVGMRTESRKIVVLITDGESTDDVTSPSRNLKDNGIEIYTVGVGDANIVELWSIASEPKDFHLYYAMDSFSFSDIIDKLTMDLCTSSKNTESVRLMNGTSLCSGRLEVKFNQSNQWWSSVCEADFDQQDAEVVCRELGCLAPSVLQGGLYGEAQAPMWTKEFQCEGHESALLDCRSSDSTRSTCSPGQAAGLTCSEPVRLVGGASRCAGTLQVKQRVWRPVKSHGWTLRDAAIACSELDCGSAVQVIQGKSTERFVWVIRSDCVQSGSTLRQCLSLDFSHSDSLEITCLESVRLMNGTSLCSGRLEVKFNQSNQWWSSVCEADFDQPDAEVVCRELGCGSPTVLRGGLYGKAQAPMWTKESQCEGHESALLDCRSSDSTRRTCSPGQAAGLTCSEPVKLVGGASRCEGILRVKWRVWRPVINHDWTLKDAAIACSELDCGSAVQIRQGKSSEQFVWVIRSDCVQSGSTLRECSSLDFSQSDSLEITCLESVRLMNGTSLCSGRLEVKFNQSNQWWSSVCEADFDQQDAEVVCRELGCGSPTVLQGGLYGKAQASMWTKEFQCEGHESALLDCRSSDSTRRTCSPGQAAGLTCSEPVKLVGGASRCEGTLQVKQRMWRPVRNDDWTLKDAAIACSELDCGSAVQIRQGKSTERFAWVIRSDCVQSGSTLRECSSLDFSHSDSLEITCLESVRLMNGTSLCSGRLEVKFNQSNQWWSSVCEADFDQQDAEVVCRELGCGSPTVLRGGLYGKAQAPMWTKESQCEGHESALLDCRSSDSTRRTCSPGQAAGLTCSEPELRLVGGASRCEGTLQVKWRVWRPVIRYDWTLKKAAIVCRELDCGSALLTETRRFSKRSVWRIRPDCVQSGSTLRECSSSDSSYFALKITCSDLLVQPVISMSSSEHGVSKAHQLRDSRVFMGFNFTISCSIEPQYPGGFFQLIFSSSGTTYNYNQPAVNHSANFLIPDADHTHQGNYACVYHTEVFSHNFSSESCQLFVTVLDPIGPIIRLVVLPLSLLLMIAVIYFMIKATRGQKPAPKETMELHPHKRPVFTADRGPGEEGGIQAAE